MRAKSGDIKDSDLFRDFSTETRGAELRIGFLGERP